MPMPIEPPEIPPSTPGTPAEPPPGIPPSGPQPEITPEIAAVLHRLEQDETLTGTEQMTLASLRRWTGIAKAPAVLELIRAEII